jgi:hypothetical protein
MKNLEKFHELHKFIEYWRERTGFSINSGLCIFNAKIKYEFAEQRISQVTKVIIRLFGYDDGKISLDEAGPLVSATFHLDFSPDFQDYKHGKKTNSLIISGASKKMHGEYRVIIKPVSS